MANQTAFGRACDELRLERNREIGNAAYALLQTIMGQVPEAEQARMARHVALCLARRRHLMELGAWTEPPEGVDAICERIDG